MAEPEEWISLRAFARRREVSLTAVQKAIADGRVTSVRRDAGGRLNGIEFHSAMAQWAANTDPEPALRSGTMPANSPAAETQEPERQPADAELPLTGGGKRDEPESAAQAAANSKKVFLATRAEREEVSLERARLELAREAGALIARDEVRGLLFRRYREIRDQLRTIPDRLADLIAAEPDAAKVRTMLLDEIDRVLHGLADQARDSAAGGPGERMAA